MRVIIVGAGDVGYVSAETIASTHDVLVIDNDASKVQAVTNNLNVSVLHEDGSNPRKLKEAIEKHRAEAIVSTLKDDAVNLFICTAAKRFDKDILTIASINNPDYILDMEGGRSIDADRIMSPEMRTAEKMYKMAVLENATDYDFVDHLGIGAAIFSVKLGSNVVGKVVLELALPPECVIFGIYRGGDLELDVDMMEIRVGDSICVAGSEKGLEKFNTFLGVKHKAVEFAILGGSIVGVNVAKMLIHRSDIKRLVTIVEHDPDRCRELTKLIPEALVLKEDFKDPRVQRNEDLFRADCLIVTSGSDDTNLLMSMSASKYNSEKVITRYFKPEYKDIFAYTNLDTIAGFYRIISNEITKCILPDEVALMRMRNYSELFFTVDVMKAPNFRNKFFGDIQIVRNAKVVAIYRNGGIIFPELDTMLLDDDKMVVFTTATNEAELKNTFGKISLPEL